MICFHHRNQIFQVFIVEKVQNHRVDKAKTFSIRNALRIMLALIFEFYFVHNALRTVNFAVLNDVGLYDTFI